MQSKLEQKGCQGNENENEGSGFEHIDS